MTATPITVAVLRQRAVRGAAWTLPTTIASRAVGLIGTLLLARYLAPDEYGVVMAASVAVVTASTVTTFGVGTYLTSNAGMSRAETFHASCGCLATGATALIVTLMAGDTLGRWSGAPGLAAFLPALILAALLERIVYVPERILVRTLRFPWLSVARAAGELTFTIASVTVAALGGGAMAIVWGSLARSVVRFAAIVPAVPIREWLEPHRLQLATFHGIAAYGLQVSVASIATFGMRRWDTLLIGRYFGAGLMGAYNYAYNLADTPATAVGEQLSDVVGASLPHVDQQTRAKALVHACAMLSLILLPLSIGLAAVAPTVVETFFDPRWANVGTMLTCLAALSLARPLAYLVNSYFNASGLQRVVTRLEWGSLIAMIGILSTIGRIGINWACACVSAVFVVRTLAGMWMVRRHDGMPIAEFLRPMTRPFAVCLVMAAGVSAGRLTLGDVTPAVRLLVEIALGAVIYVGGVLLVARSTVDRFVGMVRSALQRGCEPPVASSTAAPATHASLHPIVLSLSTEFPNPTEPGKGLFVRARLAAIAARARLFVVAPLASVDYANPHRDLFAAWRAPSERREGAIRVLHPRWLYPPRGGWMNAFFLFARLLPLLVRLRSRRSFDVIDAHFAHPEGIAAVLLGRVLRCAVFVTIRGSELRYSRQRTKRFWMAWALRRADRVIAVSENLRKLAIDLGVDPRRVKTVPNGINADVFYRRDRLACRSRYGVGAGERIILSAGDLAELKGHHRVIAAVQALNDRGLRARLLIAGGVGRSGRYAETLRQQVATLGLADRVTFLGEVTQEALAELMSAADVFCLASSTEGWPNVVNEALACGTPVIATNVGAVPQMIDDSRYGSVVPVHDGDALTEALHAALTVDWDHEAIAARGRARSWSAVADDVLVEMRAVVVGRSS